MKTSTRALTFDVIGTVVDYYSTIVREGTELSRARGLNVDWPGFVAAWRREERLGQERVERREWPWTNRDEIHRHSLDHLLPGGSMTKAELEDFNRVWDRVEPWPDVAAGLNRLRKHYILAALSNSTVASLVRLTRQGGLPWDVILSADFFQAYKPNPRVYAEAVRLLGLSPGEVMMVASHFDDLRAARLAGLKVAFVPRPLELGPGMPVDLTPDPDFDVVASDFLDLAHQLGT